MRRLRILCFVLAVLCGPTPQGYALPKKASQVLTLQESYQLALKQSEALQRRQEDVKAAEARYERAMSAIFPKLHFLAEERLRDDDYSRTDSGSSDDDDNDVDEPNGRSGNGSKNQFQTNFNVRQPLFTGFRDLYLIRAAANDIRAADLERQRAAELLYRDVADLYFQTVLYEKDLKLLAKTEKVLQERRTELQHFITLGRSRDGELIQAQSDLADLSAARERVRGALAASNEMMAFLLGMPAGTFHVSLDQKAQVVQHLDAYLAQAAERLDIRAADERRSSLEKQVVAAERLRWPSLSLEGNYYPYEDPEYKRDADVFFRLDVPLYEGGNFDAQIKEQKARLRSSELTLQEQKRIAEREVRTEYANYIAAKEQVKSLKELVNAAQKNFESQRGDYQLGVVTNLDVLASIRGKQDAERRLIEAESRLEEAVARLQVAAGGIQ